MLSELHNTIKMINIANMKLHLSVANIYFYFYNIEELTSRFIGFYNVIKVVTENEENNLAFILDPYSSRVSVDSSSPRLLQFFPKK